MGKRKVWTRILMTVSSICVLSTATVFAAASGSINDDGVNIRSAANMGSEILGTADKGTELVLHGRDGDWYQVTFNGNQNAYVSADYFDITRAEGKVQGTNINVRTGSNTKSDIIKTVNDGDVITVIGKLDGWYQLAYNNGNAYISKDYLNGDMLTYLPSVSATEEIKEEQTKQQEKKEEQKEPEKTVSDKVEDTNSNEKTTYGVVIADSYLRVRSSASTNGDVLENLSGGEIFDVMQSGADWLKIKTAEGTTGYVSTEYVSLRTGKKPDTKTVLPAPSSKANDVVSYAKQFLGTPYVWGGTDLNGGVDCSGYVYAVMQKFGVTLNRSSASMTSNGVAVKKADLAPGDLVFFDTDRNGGISHVGIYIGDGQYIHSSSGNKSGVIISDMTDAYSESTYVTARRVLK
ncbi:SH3 domain-containing protein [Clostridium sp. MD294]|uniref:C40 family peptidase n=1 Tax=Clostridium sp. MD294 TaxID=97138 RepID=UPI0002C8F620|nr:SH3 domain-containing protein [Clostridium sp. MD294]USF30459.1 hypothetical protein C820_001900 [Clostridium sp. MD294]